MITPIDLETLLRVPHVDPYTRFGISPDGKQACVSWNLSGGWELYLVALDAAKPPQQITDGPGGKTGPIWSPDGSALCYAIDIDGSENFDIMRYDPASGEHTNLTPDTLDAIQPNFAWSPDCGQIAFLSNRGGAFDAYVMPSTGGDARLVYRDPHPAWEVQWSPAGAQLLVTVEGGGQDYWTFVVPLDGSTPFPIGENDKPVDAQNAQWSPAGTHIIFTSSAHGDDRNVGLFDIASKTISWLTHDDSSKESPAWSPDGRSIAFVERKGPITQIETMDLASRRRHTYAVEPGVHNLPVFMPDGRSVLCVFSNPRHPADLWRLGLEDGRLTQLTSSLPPELKDAPFVMPQQVTYPSFDDQPVPALLFVPHLAEESPPAVIQIHGGPTWLTQYDWRPVLQHMVSRGWVVLAPNYRGSLGYGKAWQQANRFDLGGGEVRDVVLGVDYLVRAGLADPTRVSVTGRSHGGYLTMCCLTQFPDRWVAGSAIVPFLNWFTGHENSREDLQHWDFENFGDPVKDHDLWYERSPYFFLDRVKAPVQLVCGGNDPRCPPEESIEAHHVLTNNGQQCDLLLYEDEGHAFLKINNVVDSETRLIEFLASYLEP